MGMKRPVNVIIELLGSVQCSIIDMETSLLEKEKVKNDLLKELQESVNSMMTEEVSDG
tara:strand:+ start:187 stop:360 length:174 start_codon:yes stop_codon:yes gene_type:complete